MNDIQSTRQLKQLMKEYFSAVGASPKVAWCTSVGPAELLRSFGFEIYFPENHGALLGATRSAGECIPAAVSAGYSGDICSYLTGDIGAFLCNRTPLLEHYGLKNIPKPDLIVYNTNQCREVQDWFTFFANQYKCPIAGIFPPRHIDEVTKDEITDVAAQFKALIPVCEQTSGVKFNIDRFRETLRLSREATGLWKTVLATAKNAPSPFNFFDGTIHMGPIVVLRGTPAAVEYYATLLGELNELIRQKKFSPVSERSRLYWDGMPIWGKLRSLSTLFHENCASVVASTYCNSWVFDSFDEKEPFESSAKAYTELFINRSEKAKTSILTGLVREFNIDGIIFHDAKTCFNNSNARFGMPLRINRELGIPTLVIEGDLCDLRFYSEGQTTTKIEAFLEQIERQKLQEKKQETAWHR